MIKNMNAYYHITHLAEGKGQENIFFNIVKPEKMGKITSSQVWNALFDIVWHLLPNQIFIIRHLLSFEMALNVSFNIEKTIWNGIECFQNWHQIALISMVMGLINHFLNIFLLSYILLDFKMVTIDYLGHFKEVIAKELVGEGRSLHLMTESPQTPVWQIRNTLQAWTCQWLWCTEDFTSKTKEATLPITTNQNH